MQKWWEKVWQQKGIMNTEYIASQKLSTNTLSGNTTRRLTMETQQERDTTYYMLATPLESARIYLQDVEITWWERAWSDQRWKLDWRHWIKRVLWRSGGGNEHTYLSIILVMGLSIFNEPFIIWNSFINFMSNEFNPPYIMLHVNFKMH